jgi:hypothetical protein
MAGRRFCFIACVSFFAEASSAFADGSSMPYGGGGSIPAGAIIREYNQTRELFRIEGRCQSSCTMLLAVRNVCVDRDAALLLKARPAHQREPGSSPAIQNVDYTS